MNSNKVIVSGKNATTSVFINCSQSQKEEAERLEYEIKNSHTSTEEEAENEEEDNVSDDESDDDYSDYDSDEGEPEEKSSYIVGQKQKPRVERKSWYRVKKEEEEEEEDEPEDDYLMNELRKTRIQLGNASEKCRDLYFKNNEKEEEIKTWQLSVTNHEKKYEWLQNLYCEEKEKRIDLEKQLKEVSEEADMAVHNHSVDAKALFKEIALNNKLREEIEELKEELKERDKVIGKIQSNMFTLRTTIEARDRSIKTICDERSSLYDVIQSLKKENSELDDTITELVQNKNNLLKELREEKIFRRDNEDNFFRLLDEHRRLEKVMKNVAL
jgi:chromosome segregation ATPase